MYRVELTSRAQRDLKRLNPPDRERVAGALRDDLTADPPPDNLDVKPLTGAAPWLRLRVGSYRVLYRPAPDNPDVRLVDRVIHRRDLQRAVRTLE